MFQNGYLNTGVKALSSKELQDAFESFLLQDESYRLRFLQSEFRNSIDGYSFMGQKDSLNQYDFDQLHSFVLSRFNPLVHFPEEFRDFLENSWEPIMDSVKHVERQIISELNIKDLSLLYRDHVDHMISANYYPPQVRLNDLRLSRHVDVSLLTVFPFGVDEDLEFCIGDQWISVSKTDEIVVFPGYLMEKVTCGKIKAVSHRVNSRDKSVERFSFAVFSIPIPDHTFFLCGRQMNSQAYMNEYLALFS